MYLGKTVSRVVNFFPEINRRIALGWAAFSKVANIVKSRQARVTIQRKAHNEYVLPVSVYGGETWELMKDHVEQLSVAQRNIKRIILSITHRDHKRRYIVPGSDT